VRILKDLAQEITVTADSKGLNAINMGRHKKSGRLAAAFTGVYQKRIYIRG
jgi:hypothetical protein